MEYTAHLNSLRYPDLRPDNITDKLLSPMLHNSSDTYLRHLKRAVHKFDLRHHLNHLPESASPWERMCFALSELYRNCPTFLEVRAKMAAEDVAEVKRQWETYEMRVRDIEERNEDARREKEAEMREADEALGQRRSFFMSPWVCEDQDCGPSIYTADRLIEGDDVDSDSDSYEGSDSGDADWEQVDSDQETLLPTEEEEDITDYRGEYHTIDKASLRMTSHTCQEAADEIQEIVVSDIDEIGRIRGLDCLDCLDFDEDGDEDEDEGMDHSLGEPEKGVFAYHTGAPAALSENITSPSPHTNEFENHLTDTVDEQDQNPNNSEMNTITNTKTMTKEKERGQNAACIHYEFAKAWKQFEDAKDYDGVLTHYPSNHCAWSMYPVTTETARIDSLKSEVPVIIVTRPDETTYYLQEDLHYVRDRAESEVVRIQSRWQEMEEARKQHLIDIDEMYAAYDRRMAAQDWWTDMEREHYEEMCRLCEEEQRWAEERAEIQRDYEEDTARNSGSAIEDSEDEDECGTSDTSVDSEDIKMTA